MVVEFMLWLRQKGRESSNECGYPSLQKYFGWIKDINPLHGRSLPNKSLPNKGTYVYICMYVYTMHTVQSQQLNRPI